MSAVARARQSQAPPFIDPRSYSRHRPERTLLYHLVEQHYPAFRELRAAADRPLPDFVQQEFNVDYPEVDSSFRDTYLPKGYIVVGAAPGQGPFYTTLEGFESTDGTAPDFYRSMQIKPPDLLSEFPDFRNGVTVYQTSADSTPAASGLTIENVQYGPGLRPQLAIPGYKTDLIPLYSIPFKNP
jgi:hypothetical protein